MTFQREMKDFIDQHGAINNRFLTRFQQGEISEAEFRRFAIEFFHFSREWPMILAALLVNTSDEVEAAEITKILVSELGDMNPNERHELLFRQFLKSIDIPPTEALRTPKLPTTRNFLEGIQRLFSEEDHIIALGAEFGLENMAIPMWDQLLPGLKILRDRSFHKMDMTYFTFHRELEEKHEEAMENALDVHAQNTSIQNSFRQGVKGGLDLLEAFWLGLEETSTIARPNPAQTMTDDTRTQSFI